MSNEEIYELIEAQRCVGDTRVAVNPVFAMLDEQRKEIKRLSAENARLKGDPEAVHQGALAAISAIKQMEGMRATINAQAALLRECREALFVFAELPTVGWNDDSDVDVEYPRKITNRMILNARKVISCLTEAMKEQE